MTQNLHKNHFKITPIMTLHFIVVCIFTKYAFSDGEFSSYKCAEHWERRGNIQFTFRERFKNVSLTNTIPELAKVDYHCNWTKRWSSHRPGWHLCFDYFYRSQQVSHPLLIVHFWTETGGLSQLCPILLNSRCEMALLLCQSRAPLSAPKFRN